MNETEEKLRDAWKRINYYDGGSLKLNLAHPLEWHVSFVTAQSKALIIVSKYPINNIESSKSINAVCNKRSDGRYYISFQLIETSQEDVFISMCTNLIEFSSNALNEKEALKKVSSRYKQWQRLMARKNEAVLSDEKRKGLIGELLYLLSQFDSSKNAESILNGWIGPEGADQDFVYDGIWREIKTTGRASDIISIHSLEQLGSSEDHGILFIYRVDQCAPEAEDAFTLRSLIRKIMSLFNGDGDLLEQFLNKLNKAGYIDLQVYDKYTYKYFSRDEYDVNDTFPRITRNNICSQIVNCEYLLSIPAIDAWKRA